jgi:hypothetical protein
VCREHVLRARDVLAETRQFLVSLNDKRTVQTDADLSARFAAIWELFTRPVIAAAAACRVFELGRELESVAPYTRKIRSHYEVDLAAPGVLDDRTFWWTLLEESGQVVVVLPIIAIDAATLFASAFEPLVADAMSGVKARARSFAQETTDPGGQAAFVLARTTSEIRCSVFAAKGDIQQLFEAAVSSAHLTPAYVTTFCTHHTQPIDAGGWAFYRTEVVEARDRHMDVLLAALREGEARAGDGRTAARALTAAVLVAGLAGAPPESFSGDSSTHRRIANWVASTRRESPAPTREIVALARRVVRAIADAPGLAEQAWKTEELRAKWRETLADLEARLSTLSPQ